jgi:hypothetical protein
MSRKEEFKNDLLKLDSILEQLGDELLEMSPKYEIDYDYFHRVSEKDKQIHRLYSILYGSFLKFKYTVEQTLDELEEIDP